MPFTAIYTETGEQLNFYQHAERISELNATGFVCPFCEKPMLARAGGSRIRRHFYHRGGECGAAWLDGDYKNESMAHVIGKTYLAQVFPKMLARPELAQQAHIDFEHIFHAPSGQKRIADVLVTLPGPRVFALEMQLCSITPGELQERTDDYLASGIDVLWVFGGSADTHQNRSWAYRTQGYCYLLEIDFGPERVMDEQSGTLEPDGR